MTRTGMLAMAVVGLLATAAAPAHAGWGCRDCSIKNGVRLNGIRWHVQTVQGQTVQDQEFKGQEFKGQGANRAREAGASAPLQAKGGKLVLVPR